MKELELLGLGPDGESITLNDADGNRYALPITDALRAALRRTHQSPGEPEELTPRDIQRKVREGMSVDDVCELTSMAPERVEALAYPIMAEREYVASHARSIPLGGRDGMSMEEIAASRLVSRGVNPDGITWDAVRTVGEPWTLVATFVTGDREHRASWHVDLESNTFEALDDEGTWLSETQIDSPVTTWRPANTPPAQPIEEPEPEVSERSSLDAVLEALNAQRGTNSPMPSFEDEFVGAHPAPSDAPLTGDADVVLPPRRMAAVSELPLGEDEQDKQADGEPAVGDARAEDDPREDRSTEEAGELAAPGELVLEPQIEEASPVGDTANNLAEVTADSSPAGLEVAPPAQPKKRRGARPSMPSWDEIVFGKKD